MDHAALVRELDREADVDDAREQRPPRPLHGVRWIASASVVPVSRFIAKYGASSLAEIVDRHDARVLEPALHARLAQEARDRVLALAAIAAHQLDRDVAIDAHVAGEPHLAHPAASQHGAHRVALRWPHQRAARPPLGVGEGLRVPIVGHEVTVVRWWRMRVGLLVVLASSAVAHASVGVAPSAIDFGPVDIRGLPATRTVTVTNTGSVALDIAAPTETGAAAFTVAGPPAHLAAGGTVSATVTYRPAGEAADMATISFAVAGGAAVVVDVQGRGIDRHLSVAVPDVPDTFRNPGGTAPTIAVTVSNTGEANLAIASASVSGAPVWTLLDDEPVDIPGGTSYDFVVQFAPSTIGPAPPGALVLASNDAAQPALTVPLEGNGVARRVTLGPDLDLGYVGIDGTLASDVQIANLDAAHDFTIAGVTTSDPAFALSAPDTVAAADSVPLHVQFSATAPGDHETTVTLILDQDPEAADTVTLRAHAVYVDAQGGGGCNAGGGAGGGMVVAIAVLLLLRRRLRAVAVVLVPLAAHADPPRNLDMTIFDPTPSTVTGGFQLVTPALGEPGDITASALVTYAARPLVLASPQGDDVAIANRATLVLGAAWAVQEHLELGAHLPLFVQNGDASNPQTGAGTPAVRGTGTGSLTLHAKAQLVPELGAIAMVMLPTASDDRFAGEANTSARLLALAALPVAPRLTATLNFGAVLRPEIRFASYTERSAVAWGAGAAYRLSDALSLTGELFGELVPGGRRDAMNQGELLATTELLVGAHDQLDPRFVVGVAVGRGVIAGPGAPAFRGLVTLTFAPTTVMRVHVPVPEDL